MKFSLVVTSPGKMQGKALPINIPKFVIGRDSRCHLRPASALISNRHCLISILGEKIYVKDLDSTNGTFVNGNKVAGDMELEDHDQLVVGPITFEARIERQPAVDQPTPLPAAKPAAAPPQEEDEAASLLLSLPEGTNGSPSDMGSTTDPEGIPTGSTVVEALKVPSAQLDETDKAKKYEKVKQAQADTSTAASAILTKYLRRR
jgi:pSer/pThr/pTyr-binding forkhead associated (FHA) protein